MKTKKYIYIILIFYFNVSYCQDSFNVFAEYFFYNSNTNTKNTLNFYFNNKNGFSEFINLNRNEDTAEFNELDNNLTINIKNKDTIGQQFFLSKDSIIFRDHIYTERVFIPVIVSEKMPSYNWKLESDTITLSNYLCNKAKLEFRGRNFTFWYTTEIPTKFGPWKFFGLPGLIVKIESDDKTILFQLTNLKYINNYKVLKPYLGKQISFKEYITFQEKIIEDFAERLKLKLPRGATINVSKLELNSIEKNYD